MGATFRIPVGPVGQVKVVEGLNWEEARKVRKRMMDTGLRLRSDSELRLFLRNEEVPTITPEEAPQLAIRPQFA